VPTGTVQLIATDPDSEFLNDISGNRIVYTSNRAGNNDIWMYEFTVQLPEIAVAPATVDFGDVNVGSTGTSVVQVSNTGALPLTVSGIALAPSSSPFAITSSPALPATVAPGGTFDVSLAFAPTAASVQRQH
jgi:Abnormal spindle-like microcephaly-assoc'd, ASPM-SPD-2-Hydin